MRWQGTRRDTARHSRACWRDTLADALTRIKGHNSKEIRELREGVGEILLLLFAPFQSVYWVSSENLFTLLIRQKCPSKVSFIYRRHYIPQTSLKQVYNNYHQFQKNKQASSYIFRDNSAPERSFILLRFCQYNA